MDNKNKAWETFALSGKVEDYLKFKGIVCPLSSPPTNTVNDADKEDKNRRTDNKTTEYR